VPDCGLIGMVRHWPDFFIILVLLIANAGMSFDHTAGLDLGVGGVDIRRCRFRGERLAEATGLPDIRSGQQQAPGCGPGRLMQSQPSLLRP
jgi:hypothetical protein